MTTRHHRCTVQERSITFVQPSAIRTYYYTQAGNCCQWHWLTSHQYKRRVAELCFGKILAIKLVVEFFRGHYQQSLNTHGRKPHKFHPARFPLQGEGGGVVESGVAHKWRNIVILAPPLIKNSAACRSAAVNRTPDTDFDSPLKARNRRGRFMSN